MLSLFSVAGASLALDFGRMIENDSQMSGYRFAYRAAGFGIGLGLGPALTALGAGRYETAAAITAFGFTWGMGERIYDDFSNPSGWSNNMLNVIGSTIYDVQNWGSMK